VVQFILNSLIINHNYFWKRERCPSFHFRPHIFISECCCRYNSWT